MAEFVLGVDGGGTATCSMVSDLEGRIVGQGVAYGCGCYQIGGIEQAREVYRDSIEHALQNAGIRPEQLVTGILGLSGANWPEDHALLTATVSGLGLVPRFEVLNDTYIALRSGTTQRYGICVVCGTGANAAAIDPAGNRWAFNGFADWGGGLSLGKEAVRMVARAADGREQRTQLTEPLLRLPGYPSLEELLKEMWAGRLDLAKSPQLAPLVFQAERAGDEPAIRLLARLGMEMAEYAAALIRRLSIQNLPVEVVAAGGLFQHEDSLLLKRFREEVLRTAPQARIVRPALPPVAGAVLLALDSLGNSSPGVRETLQSTLPALPLDKKAAAPEESPETPFSFPLFY